MAGSWWTARMSLFVTISRHSFEMVRTSFPRMIGEASTAQSANSARQPSTSGLPLSVHSGWQTSSTAMST
jgi:hypothetical protein